ncbi:MAG: SiaB family protein kinase [Bacteroidales bacterium]|nr:SiaB family protein kinase [Bacteroidales bacterium]
MDLKDILNLFNKLDSDKISFLYHGLLHDDFTYNIIKLLEKNIDDQNEIISLKKKVAFLIAESFQNIIRHGENDPDQKVFKNKSGTFIIRNINGIFYITSVNLINNENIETLSQKILMLNNADKNQLRALQFEIMNNWVATTHGGAGLGLLQMASRSGNKFDFDFKKVNEQYSYFYFQIKIELQLPDEKAASDITLNSSKELYNAIKSNNTYLTYKGNFSQENILIIIKIIEKKLALHPPKEEGTHNKINRILTELLQNINKHAFEVNDKKEAIFIIGKHLDKYYICTGNIIKTNESEIISENINQLNQLNKEEVKALYLKKVRSGTLDKNGNAGLGLIEICRESSEKITCHISGIDKTNSFLTICVKI